MNLKSYVTPRNLVHVIMLMVYWVIADQSATVIIPYIEPLVNLLDAYDAGTLPESQAQLVYAFLSAICFCVSMYSMASIILDRVQPYVFSFLYSIVSYVKRTFFKKKEVE